MDKKYIFLLIVVFLFGFLIGYVVGYGSAINLCVKAASQFITIDEDLLNRAISLYGSKLLANGIV